MTTIEPVVDLGHGRRALKTTVRFGFAHGAFGLRRTRDDVRRARVRGGRARGLEPQKGQAGIEPLSTGQSLLLFGVGAQAVHFPAVPVADAGSGP